MRTAISSITKCSQVPGHFKFHEILAESGLVHDAHLSPTCPGLCSCTSQIVPRQVSRSQIVLRQVCCFILPTTNPRPPIPYSGKFSRGPIFAEGQSSKISRSNFRGWPFGEAVFSPNPMWYCPNWSCDFRCNLNGLQYSEVG